ncbi:MAG TPA: alpha-ketoglutarate-dependent dioxygenase AlkB [Kutzneria sp.]|jgi:alkylated DNA repair protein (DNA oxidative demethylase)
MESLFERRRVEIAAGAVHTPDWLSLEEQRRVVLAWREWAAPPAGMQHTRLPSGGVMSVQTVCLGWHWTPYRYSRTTEDGSAVKPLPRWLVELGARAVGDPDYMPDVALVNFYDDAAKMGLHQDKDERSDAPVVSLSIGDSCVFRFGNTESRNRPWTDVELRGGDLFVFGGPSRFAYHGVTKTRPGTGDPATGLTAGRLNITLRVSGLD